MTFPNNSVSRQLFTALDRDAAFCCLQIIAPDD